MKLEYIVGTDIGGSHLCSAVIDIRKNVILFDTVVNTKYDALSSEEEILNVWRSHFSSFKEMNILHFGVAIPGPFDYQNGIGLYSKNKKLGAFSGKKLDHLFNHILEKKLIIRYENDANSFGLGEILNNRTLNSKKIIAITLGTGLGSCFLENGVLLNKDPRVPHEQELYCLPFKASIADQYFSTKWFIQYIEEKSHQTFHGVLEIISSVRKELILDMFNEFCDNFIEFLSPIIEKFNPQVIILGGNISKADPTFFNNFERYLNERYQVELKFSTNVKTASLLGTSYLFKSIK